MSGSLALADVLRWTEGRLASGDPERRFDGVSIDTRTLTGGELFVAIRGPHHDAHDFLARALEGGAAGLLVDAGRSPEAGFGATPVVEVADTTRALGALASGHRSGYHGPLIAITGSNGKTTTKEMCASILATRGPCLKNEGNLNNLFGLPLTLLRREDHHRYVVVELGTNHPGEIAALAAIAQPTVGVLTNVGTAHIEFLGSREGIAREKGALLERLPADGIAILNADDRLVMSQASRTRAPVVTFGSGADAAVRAEQVSSLGERGFAFDLVFGEERHAIEVAGLGTGTIENALAAAAAAFAVGATPADVAAGLSRFRAVGGRMERVSLPRNVILINDTYNANPQSMENALQSLAGLKGGSRGLAVLGDMGELGDETRRAHAEIGALVARLGIDFLFAVGEFSQETANAALAAGMPENRVHACKEPAEAASLVREVLQGNDWVLVKGSRAMRMERIVEAIASEEAPG